MKFCTITTTCSLREVRLAPPRPNVMTLALGTAVVLLAACVSRDPVFARAVPQTPPLQVHGTLVFHDPIRQRLSFLRATNDGWDSQPYVGTPTKRAVTPDGNRLILLDSTHRKVTTFTPPAAPSDAALPASFSGLATSADSQAVVLYHDPAIAGNSSLVNTAEVALLDLSAQPPTLHVANIAGMPQTPQQAFVSPPVMLGATAHRIVWLHAASTVGVADFGADGKVRTVVVPLTPPDGKAVLHPHHAAARVAGGSLHLYLIASGSNDAVHLTIDLTGGDLSASLDQIASGADPADLQVVDAKAGLRVLTVNQSAQTVALLDPSTGTGTYVDLDFAANHILPYTGADSKAHALLYGNGASAIYTVDIDDMLKKKGKALHKFIVNQPVIGVASAPPFFLLQHASTSTGLEMFDPNLGKLTAFAGAGAILQWLLSGDSIYILGSVVGPGGVGHVGRLSRIDLKDSHGSSVDLSRAAESLWRLDGDKIAVLAAEGVGGWWTAVFDNGAVDANKPHVIEGLFLDGEMQYAVPR